VSIRSAGGDCSFGSCKRGDLIRPTAAPANAERPRAGSSRYRGAASSRNLGGGFLRNQHLGAAFGVWLIDTRSPGTEACNWVSANHWKKKRIRAGSRAQNGGPWPIQEVPYENSNLDQ
jgi:hypothetical protein